MKTEVYSDITFEKSMKTRLEQSRQKLQKLLDAWNNTGLGECTHASQLYELIWTVDIPWKEGILRLKKAPDGLTDKQGKEYLARLVFPSPAALNSASELCQQDPYLLREQGAFTIDPTVWPTTGLTEEQCLNSRQTAADAFGEVANSLS